jgi:hypothetical protein
MAPSSFRATTMPRPIPLLVISLACATAFAQEPVFTPATLKAHVTFLADDLMEGRQAGTRGYDLAARYVATRFEAIGLSPPVGGRWYQQVPLVASRLSAATLVIGDRAFPHKSDVMMGASVLEAKQAHESGVVFAGYCMDRPDLGMDDYAGLDVKGKLVACLGGFPKGMPSDVGAHLSSRKALMAQGRGAVGLLSVPTIQSARAFPWARSLEQADDPSSAWVRADGTAFREAPGIRYGALLNQPAAEALFAGAPRTLADVLAEADRAGGRPKGFALAQKARFTRESQLSRYESANVLGLIPGSDPARAKEVVVLMAHLDHIGVGAPVNGKTIRNGAIDNAAGIATLIEVARALAEAPVKPARSILFAAVTAEESGLLGSQYLAKHGVVAGGTAVAVVNLDAPILLYDFTDVIAFGEEHSTMGPMIARAVAKANVKSSPDPLPEQGIFTRSDHYSFVKEGVPGVFLVTGFANGGEKFFREYLQTHYHRPSDDLSLPIDWNAAAKFARINYLIARDLADEPRRPLWYEDSLFGKTYAPKEPKLKR